MYKIMGIIYKVLFFIPISVIKLHSKIINALLLSVCKLCELFSDYYVSYNIRPKFSDQIKVPELGPVRDSVAIIMQGPLILRDNFTLESIKLYKKQFPGVIIIVSTWDYENMDYISKIKLETPYVVQSKLPPHPGYGNVNYQVKSTMAGIQKAKELGVDFVAKTRNDQRLYKENSISFLISLLTTFPPESEKCKGRIVTISNHLGDVYENEYYVCDYFYFGYLCDIEKIFDIEMDYRNKVELSLKFVSLKFVVKRLLKKGDFKSLYRVIREKITDFSDPVPWSEYIEQELLVEILFVKRYLKKMGCVVKPEHYEEHLKKFFIPIAKNDIGLFWIKYGTRFIEHNWNCSYINDNSTSNGTYVDDDTASKMIYNYDFQNWLSLKNGKLNTIKNNND
ncbi:MAG: WavE lipopolysaccharide synthesis family protein [Clostridiales bacterium]|nr:WavE lipopolysaccharide synthesis family protein [Clostridiales bacterium]